ncbi:hypothetical protein PMG11_03112 [Penicillium brasilianum]|uniref:MACPF-like domain-containing protein n=1 Tax=Penicillium brasilianum TaxID=104259 RepID=A0A0F7V912_PENBI|nr:hypothetical protein PMG11_03112 [Penicillium brasilianum]
MSGSDIRVDINLYNPEDKSSSISSVVPLKEFVIEGKKLSDLRRALIEKGGIDASKVGCSFCSSAGAQVNDSTSLSDYLNIVSEGSSEKDDGTNTNKVHAVYLKTKSRKTDLTDETKEFLKKELNLKLSDKPELLKVSLDQLTSSFDRANWVAKAGGPSTNPADMSEKEWNIVIRNNALTSAHRLVFSNGGQDLEGKETLKFRRIERAPYSAFILKPRKFQPYEMSDAAVKVEQQFHIPRFVVNDDSYVDAFETQSSVSTSMARSSFSSIEAQASVGGGAFGFNAAVSAGFSQQESNALSSKATADEKTMNITYNFPRVVIHLDHHSLDLSNECKSDIENVKDVKTLIDFHHKYGHFFATRIELGGRLFSSEKFTTLGSASEAEATKAMKIAANVSFSSSYVAGSASFGKENQSNSGDSSSNKSMSSSVSWQAQGGNTLLCNSPPEWCPTVSPFQNWRVIKQEDVVSLGDFISMIPGYEGTRKKFDELAVSTKRKATVSFKLRLTDWQRKKRNEPEYVTLYHASPLKNDFKDHVEDIKENELPTDLQKIINNGHKGCKMDVESADNVFDIEVETVLNQAPQIEFGKRYKLFNRRNGRWLKYQTLNILGNEHSILVGGYGGEATHFEFKDGDRSGPIRANDSLSLCVYDSKGEYQGLLALAFGPNMRPLGAMRYSPQNENRIRFLSFQPVEQRFVPNAM